MRWVAALAPRCTDPVEATRSTTISVIARLMVLKGMLARVADNLPEKLNIIKCDRVASVSRCHAPVCRSRRGRAPKMGTVLRDVGARAPLCRERIVEGDTNQQFTVISDLSKSLAPEVRRPAVRFAHVLVSPRRVLTAQRRPRAPGRVVRFARQLTANELYPFVQVLIEGLADKENSSSSGVCIMLNGAPVRRASGKAPSYLVRPRRTTWKSSLPRLVELSSLFKNASSSSSLMSLRNDLNVATASLTAIPGSRGYAHLPRAL